MAKDLNTPIPLPTSNQMTNHLIESFDNPIVINHTRGHVVPQLAGHDLTTLRDFLQAQLANPKL